jgi:flagellar FliL protein
MPDKKSPDEKSEKKKDKKSGGGKSLFSTIGVSVALLGVGFMVGGKMSGGAAAPVEAAAVEEVVVPESEEVGQLVDLEAVNINLAEGRYLRVAVSLGLEVAAAGHGEEFNGAPAADVVLAVLSGRLIEELSTHEGREEVRHEILEGLHHFYGEEIVSLYFTEFVMQ